MNLTEYERIARILGKPLFVWIERIPWIPGFSFCFADRISSVPTSKRDHVMVVQP